VGPLKPNSAGAFAATSLDDELLAEGSLDDDIAGRGLILAQIISLVCLPPLMAVATFVALSSHAIEDPGSAALIAIVSSFFTAIVPCAYIVYLLAGHKINGGVDLVQKEERLRPYLVGAGSAVVGLVALVSLSAPQSVIVLTLAYCVNALVMAAITQRWKISAHAAGAAMPLTALISAFGASAWPFAVIVPVVCWARVRSRMHTVAQVCAGAILGCAITWAELAIIAPRFF
jgi:membrane-associated phospholipid phosphatase